jgi:HD-GYP domain-containing protein (c-di-GMP phosphodiesterase class II)
MRQSQSSRTAVPVDLLRPGVYVLELDRPWTETPFLFQGFHIESEEELELLRKHCRFVYADLRRSRQHAIDGLRADAERLRERKRARNGQAAAAQSAAVAKAPTPANEQPGITLPRPGARPSARARNKSLGVLIEDVAHPDRNRFTTLVQDAHAIRYETSHMMAGALSTAAKSGAIDVTAARSSAEEIAATVLEDPTAVLWLTHLRSRDDYLATHSVNVCILALAVGAHLGLTRGRLQQLGLGALLHAVGRVHIPREILDKPGPLTETERDLVRRYPEDGFRMVAESGGVPLLARQVVRRHQERWAGHGYPEGLFGDDIPQFALIAGIADAYDAMTTDRPWRAAMAPDEALQVLYENADREFGQPIVQAFMRVVGAFPIGSLVELDNAAIGMVVGLKPGAGLWPTVLMLQTPDGEPYEKRLLLNLGASDRARAELRNRRIRRARSPADVGIDPGAIVAQEFGLASASA